MHEDNRDRTGEVIGGRYRLDELLSSGGQGCVFAATDLKDKEQVAVKTLTGAKAQDPEWRERMFREARAMVSLSGTAAVRVLDQKWSDSGELCLILERLHGSDFQDYLSDREERGERFSLPDVLRLLEPIAKTLDAAHSAGILHRDVKPANIFVVSDGSVRLLDFGFAKFVTLRGLTRLGYIAGSPSYIAPETWGGESDGLDRRIDVYGLAAVVFRALAGRPPFQAEQLADLFRLVTNAPRPSLHALRPDLPPDIDAWVHQALAIDPEQRFSHVRALWNALGAIATQIAPDTERQAPDTERDEQPVTQRRPAWDPE